MSDDIRTITLRLPDTLHKRLRHLTIDLGTNMQALLIEMIQRALAENEQEEPDHD